MVNESDHVPQSAVGVEDKKYAAPTRNIPSSVIGPTVTEFVPVVELNAAAVVVTPDSSYTAISIREPPRLAPAEMVVSLPAAVFVATTSVAVPFACLTCSVKPVGTVMFDVARFAVMKATSTLSAVAAGLSVAETVVSLRTPPVFTWTTAAEPPPPLPFDPVADPDADHVPVPEPEFGDAATKSPVHVTASSWTEQRVDGLPPAAVVTTSMSTLLALVTSDPEKLIVMSSPVVDVTFQPVVSEWILVPLS